MRNPLEDYRRTQRELRRQFETFTQSNCADCPTPCCRRPARILPTDIMLAEATGWRAQLPENGAVDDARRPGVDLVSEFAGRMADALGSPPESAEGELEDLPCEFLGAKGCTFPADLRPFGCTAYICRYMYLRLDRPALTRIKRLVRELQEHHHSLLRTIRPAAGRDE